MGITNQKDNDSIFIFLTLDAYIKVDNIMTKSCLGFLNPTICPHISLTPFQDSWSVAPARKISHNFLYKQ